MATDKVRILNPSDTLLLSRDAKVLALRWDLVPWGLVLDCDAPVEEGRAIRRAWIVFDGVSDISWSMKSARLPNGFFGADAMTASGRVEGVCQYELPVLTPTFVDADTMSGNPHNSITIRAARLIGAVSASTGEFGDFGPNMQQRNALAAEEDLLQAVAAELTIGVRNP